MGGSPFPGMEKRRRRAAKVQARQITAATDCGPHSACWIAGVNSTRRSCIGSRARPARNQTGA